MTEKQIVFAGSDVKLHALALCRAAPQVTAKHAADLSIREKAKRIPAAQGTARRAGWVLRLALQKGLRQLSGGFLSTVLQEYFSGKRPINHC